MTRAAPSLSDPTRTAAVRYSIASHQAITSASATKIRSTGIAIWCGFAATIAIALPIIDAMTKKDTRPYAKRTRKGATPRSRYWKPAGGSSRQPRRTMSVATSVQPSRLMVPTIGMRPIRPVMATRPNQSGVVVNQNVSSGPSTRRLRQRAPSHHHLPSGEIGAGDIATA